MYQSVFDAFRSTLANEGFGINYMYLDNGGLVHTGIGNLIDSPDAANDPRLQWMKPDGTQASADEVTAQWNAVKARQDLKNFGGRAYEKIPENTLRLTMANVESFVQDVARQYAATIEQQVPLVKFMPADAQLGILRWAWAMGPNQVRKSAPKMWNALMAVPPDYDEAGRQSDWVGQNLAVKLTLQSLFQNATDAVKNGMDITKPLWNGKLGAPRVAIQAGGGMSTMGLVVGAGLGAAALYFFADAIMDRKRPALLSKEPPALPVHEEE